VVALVVADTILVMLLGILVVGLLRSHADIARALHELGAPLGDPSPATRHGAPTGATAPVDLRRSSDGTLQMGPAVPPRAAGTATFDLEGATPFGDALALSVTASGGTTLLAFLSSGCRSCGQFWEAINQNEPPLPSGIRTIVITKGPEAEQLATVQRQARPAGAPTAGGVVPVLMSTKAWDDYEVPGSPFFVLVDGRTGRRLGEGTARSMAEVVQLVTAATDDRHAAANGDTAAAGPPATPAGHRDHLPTVDEELAAAGIHPGDPSLFPTTMDDLVRVPRPEQR
jgi:hypothetical protein